MYDPDNAAYLACSLDAAISAAAPADDADAEIYESASMIATVLSHARDGPLCQGINVTPSGRLLSVRKRPEGSFVTGILTEANAREMMLQRDRDKCPGCQGVIIIIVIKITTQGPRR